MSKKPSRIGQKPSILLHIPYASQGYSIVSGSDKTSSKSCAGIISSCHLRGLGGGGQLRRPHRRAKPALSKPLPSYAPCASREHYIQTTDLFRPRIVQIPLASHRTEGRVRERRLRLNHVTRVSVPPNDTVFRVTDGHATSNDATQAE